MPGTVPALTRINMPEVGATIENEDPVVVLLAAFDCEPMTVALPPESIENTVEVAYDAPTFDTWKSGADCEIVPATSSLASGDVVPMPTLPLWNTAAGLVPSEVTSSFAFAVVPPMTTPPIALAPTSFKIFNVFAGVSCPIFKMLFPVLTSVIAKSFVVLPGKPIPHEVALLLFRNTTCALVTVLGRAMVKIASLLEELILSSDMGLVVPTPTFPAKYALPVVVAPPEMVRPPACVPSPMVELACELNPFTSVRNPVESKVEVAVPPKYAFWKTES